MSIVAWLAPTLSKTNLSGKPSATWWYILQRNLRQERSGSEARVLRSSCRPRRPSNLPLRMRSSRHSPTPSKLLAAR
eukprot:1704288-Lingulodinium_polyedra.AAC.1